MVRVLIESRIKLSIFYQILVRAKGVGFVNYSPFTVKFTALGKNEPFPTRLT